MGVPDGYVMGVAYTGTPPHRRLAANCIASPRPESTTVTEERLAAENGEAIEGTLGLQSRIPFIPLHPRGPLHKGGRKPCAGQTASTLIRLGRKQGESSRAPAGLRSR